MRLPRFRFTVRMLMATVAIVGVFFLLVTWAQKSSLHRISAAYYAVREANNRKIADTQAQIIRSRTELIATTERLLAGREGRDPVRAARYRCDLVREREILAANRKEEGSIGRSVKYFVAMRRMHERAARYPWLPVEPDPPEPEKGP